MKNRDLNKKAIGGIFLASLFLAAAPQLAAQVQWIGLNGEGGDGAWNQTAPWLGGVKPTASDTAKFDLNPNARVNLANVNQAISGIEIDKTGTTQFWSNRSTGSTDLTIGSGGLTVNEGAGNVSFFFRVNAVVNATQTWQNASANTLTVDSRFDALNTPVLTMTGSGDFEVNGRIGVTAEPLDSLIKSGAGTLTINGNVWTNNGSTVQSGTFLLNGDHNGGLTVDSNGTLGGTGTVKGPTSVGGNLQPGSNAIGLLTFENSLDLLGTAVTTMEIAGVTTRGTTYDAIDLTLVDGLTFGGNLVLDFDGLAETGTYNLFDISGDSFGNFANVTLAGSHDGSLSNTGGEWTGSDGLWDFTFSQSSGDLTVIPEPGTYALLFGLGVLAIVVVRRRKQAIAA